MKLVVLMLIPFGLSLYFSYGDKRLLIECIRRGSKAVGTANFVGFTRTLLVCVRTVMYNVLVHRNHFEKYVFCNCRRRTAVGGKDANGQQNMITNKVNTFQTNVLI
jgi:hypothetical protein